MTQFAIDTRSILDAINDTRYSTFPKAVTHEVYSSCAELQNVLQLPKLTLKLYNSVRDVQFRDFRKLSLTGGRHFESTKEEKRRKKREIDRQRASTSRRRYARYKTVHVKSVCGDWEKSKERVWWKKDVRKPRSRSPHRSSSWWRRRSLSLSP